MQPDDTDWKIIDILRNEYMPNNAIARKLGVSEGMIRHRIQRLKDAGIMIIKALINPDVLENQQLAVLAVNVVESRMLAAKAHEISELPGVLSVSIVSGRYDLIAELLLDSSHGLVNFLTETLSRVDGISKTESFLLLKNCNKFV
ncbi:MAG TPA: Lrp/AsnC family transcriptional regulator [Phycisphaerae bacterium]|nr:Lrp/AsnC family transcriptional regulator [Phycisphaerae bacterium]